MSGTPLQDGWRERWLSWHALRLHGTLLVVFPGCLAAGWFELTRALAGNELSWVYVFEWPFFAAFAAFLWWRLLHADERSAADQGGQRPAVPSPALSDQAADPQLQAWNEYLARLHAASPPGGPPHARPAVPRPATDGAQRHRRSGPGRRQG